MEIVKSNKILKNANSIIVNILCRRRNRKIVRIAQAIYLCDRENILLWFERIRYINNATQSNKDTAEKMKNKMIDSLRILFTPMNNH